MTRQARTRHRAAARPVGGDQSEVFAFLADPATYHLATPVTRIDTHGAAVFLAGPDVYKVKRAVRFPFMDLSTLDKRRAACEAEVAVNRKYAPELYLGTLPITRTSQGLSLGGAGDVVEWAVHLKRFDEARTLDQVAGRGELDPPLVARLARTLLAVYADAEIRDGESATAALEGVVEETLTALADAPEVFPPDRAARLAAAMRGEFGRMRPLLRQRGAKGCVRRCHGDLHLRNIVLLDREPTLFDAIEFDESIATTDILYDFAFLLMDLWERGIRPQANLLLNRYLWGSPDLAGEVAGLAALPLFLSLRSLVRAKVDALRYIGVDHDEATKRDALRYFDTAESFLAPAPPTLVAVGGFSGTGKSTLAARIAPALGRAPGAVHLRSDIERKRLFGVGETDRLPEEAYRQEITEQVFAALRRQAEIALKAGHSVVIDAVHRQRAERAALAAVAARCGAAFTGLWLDAPIDVLIERVSDRQDDASDANARIVARQVEESLEPVEWIRLDASGGLDDLAAAALKAVAAEGDRAHAKAAHSK